uniref:Ig-like domain-containing protein n=1 Tax=Oncorhynchus mykiss TaxID=8022 RepID=A0A8C7LWH4_ONCMY
MKSKGLVMVILLSSVCLTDGGDVYVTCVFSEDCVMPCSFMPGSEEVIHWLKPVADLTVHSYYYSTDQLQQQSLHYRRRTALFNDQIHKGNASLLLNAITLQDQGRYKCYTSTVKGNKESFINISVEAPVHLVNIQLSDDIITCSSKDIYPEPKLTWSTNLPSDMPLDPGTIQTSTKVDDRGLYDITSTKQFSRDRTNICTVTSGTRGETGTLRQQDPVQCSPSSEVSIPCRIPQSDLLTFNLTWRFNQIVNILTATYTKGTPQMYINDQWKEQVQDMSESGSLQLHRLTVIHQGSYSCELYTSRDTHLFLTYLEITPDKLSAGTIVAVVFVVTIAAVATAAGVYMYLKKRGREDTLEGEGISDNEVNHLNKPLNKRGEERKTEGQQVAQGDAVTENGE